MIMHIESMTGYGSAERGDYRVELRSVNHKNLDINLNMPPYLYRLDPEIRKRVRKIFSRGRIDVYVSRSSGARRKIKVNKGLAKEYHRALLSLRKDLGIKDEINMGLIASNRDIFLSDDPGLRMDEFTKALDLALKKLKSSRAVEGKKLVADIKKRAQKVGRYLQKIRSRRKAFISRARADLQERLNDILRDMPVDETRLIQESAILAERSDITEEVVRIKSHLDYMRDILRTGNIVGKKLDFVIQELRREVNTIGSKSSDIDITVSVVEMKDELEKIREQVQNLQ
jgi:uncharacterized protein (TIGR00255 family)